MSTSLSLAPMGNPTYAASPGAYPTPDMPPIGGGFGPGQMYTYDAGASTDTGGKYSSMKGEVDKWLADTVPLNMRAGEDMFTLNVGAHMAALAMIAQAPERTFEAYAGALLRNASPPDYERTLCMGGLPELAALVMQIPVPDETLAQGTLARLELVLRILCTHVGVVYDNNAAVHMTRGPRDRTQVAVGRGPIAQRRYIFPLPGHRDIGQLQLTKMRVVVLPTTVSYMQPEFTQQLLSMPSIAPFIRARAAESQKALAALGISAEDAVRDLKQVAGSYDQLGVAYTSLRDLREITPETRPAVVCEACAHEFLLPVPVSGATMPASDYRVQYAASGQAPTAEDPKVLLGGILPIPVSLPLGTHLEPVAAGHMAPGPREMPDPVLGNQMAVFAYAPENADTPKSQFWRSLSLMFDTSRAVMETVPVTRTLLAQHGVFKAHSVAC